MKLWSGLLHSDWQPEQVSESIRITLGEAEGNRFNPIKAKSFQLILQCSILHYQQGNKGWPTSEQNSSMKESDKRKKKKEKNKLKKQRRKLLKKQSKKFPQSTSTGMFRVIREDIASITQE